MFPSRGGSHGGDKIKQDDQGGLQSCQPEISCSRGDVSSKMHALSFVGLQAIGLRAETAAAIISSSSD